jgi:hypothetical protein
MPDISSCTADRDVMRSGEWVPVGTGDDRFEIRTRGFTQAYRDGLNRLRREAARELNRKLKSTDLPHTPEMLPPSVDDRCQGQALADYCVIDVRGLTNGGQPVSADEFKALLRDPEGRQALVVFALQAAIEVGRARTEQKEIAEGNL